MGNKIVILFILFLCGKKVLMLARGKKEKSPKFKSATFGVYQSKEYDIQLYI